LRFTFDPITIRLPAYFRDSANILLFPKFTISEPYPSLGGRGYHNQPNDTQGIQNSIVYQRGRHNLKAALNTGCCGFTRSRFATPPAGSASVPTTRNRAKRAPHRQHSAPAWRACCLGSATPLRSR